MSVLLPESLTDALEALAADPATIPMAGGTDLLVHWPDHPEVHARTYLDLSGLEEELRPFRWAEQELILGGLTTYWDLIEDQRTWETLPLLIDAARQVGAVQIQTRGTWAGNIVNGSPAADGVPVLMAYDALVVLESLRGRVEVPLSEFYTGYKQMRRQPDELITEIRVPLRAYDFQLFEKVGSRKAQAITKVGVAVTRSDGRWRVVANSVAPVVCRCPSLEELLEQGAPVASPEDLIPPIRSDVAPIDDIRSTAVYRERVLANLLYHDLLEVCPSFT